MDEITEPYFPIEKIEDQASERIHSAHSVNQKSLKSFLEHYANRLLKSKLFPWLGRWILLFFLLPLSYSALFGPREPHENFATVFSWLIWWPLLALSYLLVGRIWCSVCPMGAVADILNRKVGLKFKSPDLFKKRWVVTGLFVAMILYQAWMEEITRASASPLITGFILWSFTVGAGVSGLLFERWTWCRHLCPLGAISGTFAMTSFVEVRANQDICLANRCKGIYCYFGRDQYPGCPFNQVPKIMDTNRYCSACGNCLKACPNDAIRIRIRAPGNEFITQKKTAPESALLSIVVLGVVAFEALVMTKAWADFYEQFVLPVFANDALLYGALLVLIIGITLAVFFFAVRCSTWVARKSWDPEFLRFGFAFLPLALLAHIGHNLGHFFSGYQYIPGALINLITPSAKIITPEPPLLGGWQILEILLVVAGLVYAIYSIQRICKVKINECKNHSIPFVALALFYSLLLIGLFILPMYHRV